MVSSEQYELVESENIILEVTCIACIRPAEAMLSPDCVREKSRRGSRVPPPPSFPSIWVVYPAVSQTFVEDFKELIHNQLLSNYAFTFIFGDVASIWCTYVQRWKSTKFKLIYTVCRPWLEINIELEEIAMLGYSFVSV